MKLKIIAILYLTTSLNLNVIAGHADDGCGGGEASCRADLPSEFSQN